ncbi:hypothetical protein MPTK1_4g04930 [Marchantia polymorpha subsp. ruderalis]|uniref:Uncharacterized protein n=2 Tax=Marchantia polymorpha TaxID=3197 RepID=A0AAF6B6G8_MARPO|nr:hypothetical protein MARPO_0150s0017 [Marchantia polymorpha]PTQ28995.1 hypothetical protein MARPO_0150s0017 [Marchantia polymorpha]BBN07602.1 hypothetical protein Mp_4g04930 [Marchantia polymorpha subsp. ruderalis]BBN07603.1 hypothetical protein Mp_4g04930 [Marchantia polymorpha subsp. ruderalis]|eukprot:PTQ28994.1 hypothetical protein MARPO_0150s0017 [Marchantia polymorpha]
MNKAGRPCVRIELHQSGLLRIWQRWSLDPNVEGSEAKFCGRQAKRKPHLQQQ